MKLPSAKQNGAALIVALVALVILTVLGVTTLSDVMNQSSVVRNEQFRQRVFYAASSELNAQIDAVNRNAQSEDDAIIDDLLETGSNGSDMWLPIGETEAPFVLTDPQGVNLRNLQISGNQVEHFSCPGESIGKVNVLSGTIDARADLDDGRGSIKSIQTQRYIYCWP